MINPIADMFTRIRNANMIYKKTVVMPYSKNRTRILDIMVENHLLYHYKIKNRKSEDSPLRDIVLLLRYHNKERAITNLKLISTKNKPVYVKKDNIPYLKNGYGLVIISTSKGLMSGKDARRKNIGGAIIGYVW